MDWLWPTLIGLHVLFAVVWFGGTVAMSAIVGPALSSALPNSQSDVGPRLSVQAHRVFRPMAFLTIMLGAIIGVHLGQIRSAADIMATPYGHTLLLALVLAIAVFLWGEFVTGRLASKIAKAPVQDRPKAIQRTIQASGIEMLIFLATFATMVLLRFGL